MKGIFRHLMLLAVVTTLVACTQTKPRLDLDLMAITDEAAGNLLAANRRTGPLDAQTPLLVASFVDIDNLLRSSTFGRMSSELFAASLTQRGYHVVEVKLRDQLFIQHNGEFMLSRKLKDISSQHQVESVVIGTYATGIDYVYVTVKLINIQTSEVERAWKYRIPRTDEMRSLLPPRRGA